MKPLIEPIHIGGVGIGNLRFYAPETGRRQFPWADFGGLCDCLSVSPQMRETFRRDMRSESFADMSRTVATQGGIITLVTHAVAQGVVDANVQLGRCGQGQRLQYDVEAAEAMKVLTFGMEKAEFMAYLKEAWTHAGGAAR